MDCVAHRPSQSILAGNYRIRQLKPQYCPCGRYQANSGHHHLLVDMDKLPALDMPLPASDQVIHFGKGQTETTIELSSGSHSLQLLLGNYAHVPHSRPVISEKITIVVE